MFESLGFEGRWSRANVVDHYFWKLTDPAVSGLRPTADIAYNLTPCRLLAL